MSITPYDKTIAAVIGIVLLVLNNLVSANFGFSPNVIQIINIAVSILTPISVYLASNKNAATLQPGQVVVSQSQVVPGTVPVAAHKP